MLTRRLAVAAAALTIGVSTVSAAQETPRSPMSMMPGQIVAGGEGEVTITPDRARVFVGVQTRAVTAAAASAENARRQRAVLDTLRALGLSSEQLTTMNYSVSPEMQYDQSGRAPRVTGYVVSNTVRAEVRKLDDVARVIDASLAKGANQINSLQFYSSNSDEARRAAIAQAVAQARGDAETMAKAAGGTLGWLMELTTGEPQARPMFEMAMPRMAAGAVAQPTPIEPGQQVVRATVTGRWLFEHSEK